MERRITGPAYCWNGVSLERRIKEVLERRIGRRMVLETGTGRAFFLVVVLLCCWPVRKRNHRDALIVRGSFARSGISTGSTADASSTGRIDRKNARGSFVLKDGHPVDLSADFLSYRSWRRCASNAFELLGQRPGPILYSPDPRNAQNSMIKLS